LPPPGAGSSPLEPQPCQGVAFPQQLSQGATQMEVYDAKKTTTEVRQANHQHGNFWVLIISMASVIALFAIIYFVFFANTPPSVIS
jgi:anti-sigma-K factor RskA